VTGLRGALSRHARPNKVFLLHSGHYPRTAMKGVPKTRQRKMELERIASTSNSSSYTGIGDPWVKNHGRDTFRDDQSSMKTRASYCLTLESSAPLVMISSIRRGPIDILI
jgi:hypothetical protein